MMCLNFSKSVSGSSQIELLISILLIGIILLVIAPFFSPPGKVESKPMDRMDSQEIFWEDVFEKECL